MGIAGIEPRQLASSKLSSSTNTGGASPTQAALQSAIYSIRYPSSCPRNKADGTLLSGPIQSLQMQSPRETETNAKAPTRGASFEENKFTLCDQLAKSLESAAIESGESASVHASDLLFLVQPHVLFRRQISEGSLEIDQDKSSLISERWIHVRPNQALKKKINRHQATNHRDSRSITRMHSSQLAKVRAGYDSNRRRGQYQ
jgi:hypothetical protein